jgi:hypothetical protein
MTQIIIKLAPNKIHREMYNTDRKNLVRTNLSSFQSIATIETELEGEEAAEEAFDLTNNPSRQEERVKRYGRHRSVSVGDVISVDGIDFMCDTIDWVIIEPITE